MQNILRTMLAVSFSAVSLSCFGMETLEQEHDSFLGGVTDPSAASGVVLPQEEADPDLDGDLLEFARSKSLSDEEMAHITKYVGGDREVGRPENLTKLTNEFWEGFLIRVVDSRVERVEELLEEIGVLKKRNLFLENKINSLNSLNSDTAGKMNRLLESKRKLAECLNEVIKEAGENIVLNDDATLIAYVENLLLEKKVAEEAKTAKEEEARRAKEEIAEMEEIFKRLHRGLHIRSPRRSPQSKRRRKGS